MFKNFWRGRSFQSKVITPVRHVNWLFEILSSFPGYLYTMSVKNIYYSDKYYDSIYEYR